MVRTQVQLSETQAQILKQFAAQEDQSIAELIRQAVDLWIESKMKAPNLAEKRRRARLVPTHFRSGLPDLAVKHDYYLAEAISGDPRDLKALQE